MVGTVGRSMVGVVLVTAWLLAASTAALATDGDLSTYGTAGTADTGTAMMAGTSPAIAGLSGGGYELAWQPDSSVLTVAGPAANGPLGVVMSPGTSPSIAALPSNGYEVAVQGQNTSLWTAGTAGVVNWGLGMETGTSPAITALSSGYESAFQSNHNDLYTAGYSSTGVRSGGDTGEVMNSGTNPAVAQDGASYATAYEASNGELSLWNPTNGNSTPPLGMDIGTSPAGAALSTGGDEYAFQANSNILWNYAAPVGADTTLKMSPGTTPSIAGLAGGGYEIAFQSSAGQLQLTGAAGSVSTGLAMAPNTSPSITGLSSGGYEVAFQAVAGSTASVVTTPTATPVPTPAPTSTTSSSSSKSSKQLAVRITLKWIYDRRRTQLRRFQLGHRPSRTTLTESCRGRGCGVRHRVTAEGRELTRMLHRLVGTRFRAGDRLFITLSAPQYVPERVEVLIRASELPAISLIGARHVR